MAETMLALYNQSSFLPHYRNLLPKSVANETTLFKKSSTHTTAKRCGSSSSYRHRLKRLKTNCQLIRERRPRPVSPSQSIQLRPSVFQQRSYRSGSLELLQVNNSHWQSSNFLRLSDEYLYKCKYATFASKSRIFQQSEFYHLLKELFSCSSINEAHGLYRCQLCQNKFHSNEMFDLHLHRRSVSIDYQCLTCQARISASNPCQAYAHLLTHGSHPTEKRIAQLTMNCNRQQCLVGLLEYR